MGFESVFRSRTARWLVPVTVVGLVAAGVVVDGAVAGADPSLPATSAADLLASLSNAGATPFSGSVSESADLGFPAIPGASSTSLSPASLLTGTHEAQVWYSSPRQVRVSLTGDLAESDVVRNGHDLWVWSSTDFTVTHVALPTVPTRTDAVPPIDPSAAAQRVLADLDPTTSVTVDGTSRVAGRAVYELVLAPRSSSSLIGQVRIAVDSESRLPLRVQVFARGATSPAFETAFTSITLARPADSVFAFTPPAGATVTQSTLPTRATSGAKDDASGAAGSTTRPRVIGSGWTSVLELPDSTSLTGGTGAAGSGSAASALNVLLRSTTVVQGGFGTGRLLQTALVSALLLPDGRLFLGAVTPELLEQVAGSSTR